MNTTQTQPDLLTALTKIGISNDDALGLALAYPNVDPDKFIEGLQIVAAIILTKQKKVYPRPAETPFDFFYDEMQKAPFVDNGFDTALNIVNANADAKLVQYLMSSIFTCMSNNTYHQAQNANYLEENELGDAKVFALLHKDQVVYDFAAKEWFIWKGNFWEPDTTGEVYNLAFEGVANFYLREAQKVGGTKKLEYTKRVAQLRTKKRIEAILAIATHQEKIRFVGDEWDLNPLILGVNNGVIDLADGTFRIGSPTEYIRVHAPTDWEGIDAPAPMWEKFIGDVFDNDPEMIGFIHRLFGYCITGKTTERTFPVLWGGGSNGKTTLLEVVAFVLGNDYAMTVPAGAIMIKDNHNRQDNDPRPYIFALRGKRLVWASEAKDGAKIDMATIKALSGRDSITTRTLFEKPITFLPTHKVMLLTNPLPHIDTEDQAMWDRVKLIPFKIRFIDDPKGKDERKRDMDILEKLKLEKAGVLAWLVKGCLEWQKQGLNPPDKVKYSTDKYREAEDSFIDFVAEQCDPGKGATLVSVAFKYYQEYTALNNLTALTSKGFKAKMEARFGVAQRKSAGMVYDNVTVMKPLP